ncbi:ABC-2 type transport system ATP-binding protein [Actinokineospora iranica]|uniref:ABC-2 type transport system ATP-binding protein n=1 Tax=Actinokineospora iranica TaxID=1271860 RepID=A0A1G6W4D2_9PSEU|nr:ABC-2 type transport system ATP-binding protein [Actinokineospora iranica]
MQDGSGRIVVQNLTKNFGPVAAVQNLSFHVEPGSVTGFLGPNGAGKTTTLRMLLGLVRPTSGFATINGQPFAGLGNPGRVVGAVLEAQGFHPKRTAINHLRVYTAAMGLTDQRADEVLGLVGLGAAANRAAGGFSLGMKQRLALATALLGDPQVLVLDEPANGLDPEGIAWLRTFLKAFAASGRTVLISSHLLAEVEQTIDQVVIVSRGQTMYYGKLDDLRRSQQSRVIVQPADPTALATALQAAGITGITPTPDGKIAVVDATVQQIGDIAAKAGTALYGVQEERVDLEQLFFRLTSGQWAAPSAPGYGVPQYQQGPQHQQPYQQQPYQQQGYQQQGYAPPGTPPQGGPQPVHTPSPGTPQITLPFQGDPQAFAPPHQTPPQGDPRAYQPPQGTQHQAVPPQGNPQAFAPPQGNPQAFAPPQGAPQTFAPAEGNNPQPFAPPQGDSQAFAPQQSGQQPGFAQPYPAAAQTPSPYQAAPHQVGEQLPASYQATPATPETQQAAAQTPPPSQTPGQGPTPEHPPARSPEPQEPAAETPPSHPTPAASPSTPAGADQNPAQDTASNQPPAADAVPPAPRPVDVPQAPPPPESQQNPTGQGGNA